jgi:hypothetical protein
MDGATTFSVTTRRNWIIWIVRFRQSDRCCFLDTHYCLETTHPLINLDNKMCDVAESLGIIDTILLPAWLDPSQWMS